MDVNENTLPPGVSASGLSGASADSLGGGDWEVGDCLGTWWRPNYETYMVSYNPLPLMSFQIIVFPSLSQNRQGIVFGSSSFELEKGDEDS